MPSSPKQCPTGRPIANSGLPPLEVAPDVISYADGGEEPLFSHFSSGDFDEYSPSLRQLPWPLHYHLTPSRKALLNWIDFGQNPLSILELGAGCGALTSFLVSVPGASVVALEGSRRRAEIIQQRCRRACNLVIHAGNIAHFKPKTRFDVVTLVGVLEYAGKYSPGEDPFRAVLELAHSWLSEAGCLILAIENRLGHKYLAGLPEDHYTRAFEGVNGYLNYEGIKTFDQSTLRKLLESVGLAHQSWFYPFPDYKIPRVVLGSNGIDAPDFDSLTLLDLPTTDGSTNARPMLHERALLKALRAHGSLAPFMNSFLVMASPSANSPVLRANRNLVAVKTNLDSRGPLFQTQTTFLRQADHTIIVSRKKLQKRPASLPSPCQHTVSTERERYHSGMDNLLDLLFDALLANEAKPLPVLLRHWSDGLMERVVIGGDEERTAFQSFAKQYIGRELYHSTAEMWLPGDCLDLHPGNILINCQLGQRVVIQDLEWRMQFKLPLQLVFDRGLYILAQRLRRCAGYLKESDNRNADVPASIVRHFRSLDLFRSRDWDSYRAFEAWFQRAVVTSDLGHSAAAPNQPVEDQLLKHWTLAVANTFDAEAWSRLVTFAHQSKCLPQALALCRERLNSNPRELPLLFATATIAQLAGDSSAAAACYQRILVISPENDHARQALESMQDFASPETWYAHASQLASSNELSACMDSLKGLVRKYPNFASAHNDLGVLFLQSGNAATGLHHLELAAQLLPTSMEVLKNLASVYQELGRGSERDKLVQRIARLSKASDAPSNELLMAPRAGVPCLTPQGIGRLGTGLQVGPGDPLLAERSALIRRWLTLPQNEFQLAYQADLRQSYQHLLASGVRDCGIGAEEWQTLSSDDAVAQSCDGLEGARRQLASLLYGRPHLHPAAIQIGTIPSWLIPDFIEFMLVPPALFREKGEAGRYCVWLEDFVAAIHEMVFSTKDAATRRSAAVSFANHANYIQAYFNELNVRTLYAQRGRLLTAALEGMPISVGMTFPPRSANTTTIRLGIIASHLAPAAETFALLPMIENLGKGFELFIYCTHGVPSQIQDRLAKVCDKIRVLGTTLTEQVIAIREDKLDALFFGTNVTAVTNSATALAVFRLARTHITGPAAVTTSGMPNMDYYISGTYSDRAVDAEAHYTEKLLRISGPAQCFAYPASEKAEVGPISRTFLGMGTDDVVFVSAANMFKMTPELLHAWARILVRVPKARLFLLPFGPNWTHRYPKNEFAGVLRHAMEEEGVSVERVLIADWSGLDRDDVRALLGAADIYLDAFPFSSTTSLIEPLEAGLPVICKQGTTFRSSMGAAIMHELALSELVAESEEDYVALAERLANSEEVRSGLKERIVSAMRGGPRFINPKIYGKAMADVFREIVGQCMADA